MAPEKTSKEFLEIHSVLVVLIILPLGSFPKQHDTNGW
jgi:hypothetical protein